MLRHKLGIEVEGQGPPIINSRRTVDEKLLKTRSRKTTEKVVKPRKEEGENGATGNGVAM